MNQMRMKHIQNKLLYFDLNHNININILKKYNK
jgi:hypothetical protein